MLQASPGSTHELQIGQQKVNAHRNPDLGHDSILRGAEKGLDLEVLLDPLKEQLDLPARLVDGRDRGCSQLEIVGQENVLPARFGVAVSDTPQRDRTRFPLGAGQLDGLITGQVLPSLDLAALSDAEAGILLLPGNKRNSSIIQLVIPGVVGVTTIKGNNRSARQCQCATRRDIVSLAVVSNAL